MTYPFTRPNDTSSGGAGGGGAGGQSGGSGRVSVQIPPRTRPFPCSSNAWARPVK